MRIRIASTGFHAPPRVETAAELAPRLGVSERWIVRHTGVSERRVADEPVEVLAARAARAALGSGPPADVVVFAAPTVRQAIPDTAVFVARELGYAETAAFSVHATCLSFVVALRTVGGLVRDGVFRRALIVSADVASVARNLAEPETAALLGDGAAAVVVEATPEGDSAELLSFRMTTWPAGAELARLTGFGARRPPELAGPEDRHFAMEGKALYRFVRERGGDTAIQALADAGLTPATVDWVVPHQMSGPGLRAFKYYGFRPERVIDILGRYGNCVAASLPMALHLAVEDGRLRRGQTALLVGTGAGVSVAASVIRF